MAKSFASSCLRRAIAAAILMALAGCITRGGPIPYDPAGFGAPDRPVASEAAYDLPIGPLDVLHVTVFRVADLTGDYQVDGRGNLNMPLIGTFSVRDQDEEALAADLRRRYGARYLNNPDITVRVLTSNYSTITVEGGVTSPGVFNLAGKTTLLSAIAMAKGVNSTDANPKRVAIFRKRGGKTLAAEFDLYAIRKGQMEDPVVYPGDTIAVESSLLRQLYRDLIATLPAIAIFNQL